MMDHIYIFLITTTTILLITNERSADAFSIITTTTIRPRRSILPTTTLNHHRHRRFWNPFGLQSTAEDQVESLPVDHNNTNNNTNNTTTTLEEDLKSLPTKEGWNPNDEEIIHGDNCWLVVDDDDDDDDDVQQRREECEDEEDLYYSTTTPISASLEKGNNNNNGSISINNKVNGKNKNDDFSNNKNKKKNGVGLGGSSPRFLPYDEDATQMELLMDKTLRLTPFFLPVLAFNLYDPTAALFADVIELLSNNNNWIAVDGGLYQATIIAPAINGVVIASMSMLFAILIGQTISKLHERQIDIQRCLNVEASRLIQLRQFLMDFPSSSSSSSSSSNTSRNTAQRCKQYLQQYTSRLVSECHETINLDLDDISRMDSELTGVMQELNLAAASMDTKNEDDDNNNVVPAGLLLDQTMAAVEALIQQRSKRITALQSTFPPLHYVILATLALSICVAFLMETDQDILVFLTAIQLRLLWTMLVATFCALGLVCYDLGHPFRGAYQISASVKELYDVRQQYIRSLSLDGTTTTTKSIVEEKKKNRNNNNLL